MGGIIHIELQARGTTNEAFDPYAKSVGVNGMRDMVIDLNATIIRD